MKIIWIKLLRLTIYKFVEGIVVGQNISDENCFILHQLVDGNTIIRRIHFDNIITRIQDI